MKVLDLFCGAGGCSYGYHLAGFEVVGVDIADQPSYPFEFVKADAIKYLDTADLSQFDAIHASPPCQAFTAMLNWDESKKSNHPDLVDEVRKRLLATGKPYVIENVPGAPLNISIILCGSMFPELRVIRHRIFESNIFLFQPGHPNCRKIKVAKASKIPKDGEFWSPVGCFGQKDDAQRAMGITWMKTTGSRDREIAQAIPPAYTRFIGEQLINAIVGMEEAV
jgi:DNA (cytosine-5)-methyltransferase 1